MPTLNFSATYIYKNILLECLTVLLESIDLSDTVDDITQKDFEGAPPPTFQGFSIIPSLPLGSYMQYCTACLNLDSDMQKSIRSKLWINLVKSGTTKTIAAVACTTALRTYGQILLQVFGHLENY